MIRVDLSGRAALVTGGTRGLGKAIGLTLAAAGATLFVTHRWGSVQEEELIDEFRRRGLDPPRIVEADVGDPEATRELMSEIAGSGLPLHVIVSNVAFAKTVDGLGDMKKNALDLSIGYSAWPLVDLVQASMEILPSAPRYVIGVSSDGGSRVCHHRYDLAGVSKAALEALCRYLALRLKPHGTRVNVLVPGLLDTQSFASTFGDEVTSALRGRFGEVLLDPEAVAGSCLALCSGLMDSVTGQSIVVDEGWGLLSLTTLVADRLDRLDFCEGGQADGSPLLV